MSLQDLTIKTIGTEGIKKQIDQNSIDIVFDILQVYAYSNPIQSTVRELTSNAVDAQREKEIAIEILTGTKRVEDYFLEKQGKEYEDSKFDINYYKLEYLDREHNNVELEYIEASGSGYCNSFIVRDYGVGLGDKRLEGILKLGYSSKRNTKEQIGGYGMGQKAALATLAPFYTIISVHNGRLFKLNVYSKKADSLIEAFNLDTGTPNSFISLSILDKDGKPIKIHYEKTTSKNYTEVIVPTKQLNKSKFFDAVNSQLLYLPNVVFNSTSLSHGKENHRFKAEILYESENIIISKNSQFSKPHLIVVKDKASSVGICYNEINYAELELQQRYGAVALKVQMRATIKDENGNETLLNDGIAVTPNREQVIWNDDTKAYLTRITANVASEATTMINKELLETDFLKWIRKATEAISSIRSGTALYELAHMIDRSSITPEYSKDKAIRFTNTDDMFWGMNARWIHMNRHWSSTLKKDVEKVERITVDGWDKLSRPVYLQVEDTSNSKDRYIIQGLQKEQTFYSGRDGGFITIQLLDTNKLLEEKIEELKSKEGTSATDKAIEKYKETFQKYVTKRDAIYKFLSASKEIAIYDDIVVPEEFKKKDEEITAAGEAEEVAAIHITPEEFRKMNGQVVLFTPRVQGSYSFDRELIWNKKEITIKDIPTLAEQIFYGFDDDADALKNACKIVGNAQEDWFNDNLKIIKIAKNNERYFKQCGDHISSFFWHMDDNNNIIMTPEIIAYYTGQLIDQHITDKMSFLTGYMTLNPDITKIYNFLIEYRDTNYADKIRIPRDDSFNPEKELNETLDKYAQFQIFIQGDPTNTAAIATKSLELFNTEYIAGCTIIDTLVFQRLSVIEEYIEDIHELFNVIAVLNHNEYTGEDPITTNQEKLLQIILKAKGLDTYIIPEELLINS